MCLITVAINRLPTTEEMDKAMKTNSDGVGIGFRKNGKVQFVKGLSTIDQMQAVFVRVELPVVIHYRMASVGNKCAELCHPFPLTADVPLDVEGETEALLFHNGHISNWQEPLRNLAIARNESIPNGAWSDTRAVAWIVARLGKNMLKIMDGKYVYFTGKTCMMYGGGWSEVKTDDKVDMYHSNTHWENKWVGYSSPAYTGPSSCVVNRDEKETAKWSPREWKNKKKHKGDNKSTLERIHEMTPEMWSEAESGLIGY